MTALELYVIGRKLQLAGWKWETWSGSFSDKEGPKGWWFIPGAEGVRGMRRGDPKPYDLATVTTHKLYQE